MAVQEDLEQRSDWTRERIARYRLDRFEGKSSPKDAQDAKEPLFLWVKQIVGPGDRAGHGLKPRGSILRTADEQWQGNVHPIEQLSGRQELRPRGRQFNSQRQSIQPPADGGYGTYRRNRNFIVWDCGAFDK